MRKEIGLDFVSSLAPVRDLRAELQRSMIVHRDHMEFADAHPQTLLDLNFETKSAEKIAQFYAIVNDQDFSAWMYPNPDPRLDDVMEICPDYWLHTNRTRCGLLKHYLVMQMRSVSMAFASSINMHLMAATHLYSGARLLKPDMPKWSDMELFIELQSPEHVFVGGRPTTMEQAFKKASLAFGASAQLFAAHQRSNDISDSSSTPETASILLQPRGHYPTSSSTWRGALGASKTGSLNLSSS